MALPVLDGNQSATTLSSVVTGGEHIVAHTVVSLGATAISNITSAVSGSVVSVSNFPASQSTTFGAVTGSVSVLNFPSSQIVAGTVTANVDQVSFENYAANYLNPWPVSIVQIIEGLNVLPIAGTVTVGNTVAISGTVTANPTGTQTVAGTVTVSGISTSVTARLINPAGTAVTYAEVGTAGSPSIDVLSVQGVSGGTSLPISGTAGTLTTRFGSVTTANTSFATSAVTNTSRRYLLIQNVTTGGNAITVGIGFTPTTTQGIQLTAGAGITFESSYIPTGQVFVLSSVTASNFTILEA